MGKSIYMYLVNFLDLPYTFVSKSKFKMECGEYIYNLINIIVHLRIIYIVYIDVITVITFSSVQ